MESGEVILVGVDDTVGRMGVGLGREGGGGGVEDATVASDTDSSIGRGEDH